MKASLSSRTQRSVFGVASVVSYTSRSTNMHSIDWAFWFRVGEMISIAVAAFFVGRVYQFRKTQHLETLNKVLMARNLMQAYQQATKHIDAAKSRTTQMIEKQDEIMRELMSEDDAPRKPRKPWTKPT